jgi:hypothetical protein
MSSNQFEPFDGKHVAFSLWKLGLPLMYGHSATSQVISPNMAGGKKGRGQH